MVLNLPHQTGALPYVIPCKRLWSTLQKRTIVVKAPMPGVNLHHQLYADQTIAKALVSNQTPYPDQEDMEQLLHLVAKGQGVPVYVMLPLDTAMAFNDSFTVNESVGCLKDCIWDYKTRCGVTNVKDSLLGLMGSLSKTLLFVRLTELKNAGVGGVMVNIWWGLVERDGPSVYNWSRYTDLMEMAKQVGLKVQAVMSFHQCGGNVGDSVTISLPKWVVKEMERNVDICYSDQWGCRNCEYVSLGCDTLLVLKGRSPIQCYADFMKAFGDQFASYLGTTIIEIQVGMGPAGELRYPSYPEVDGIWKFPGIGAFQCFDKYMLNSLKTASLSAGKPEWDHSGPTDASGYNYWPHNTAFFCEEGGGWNGQYGEFFLSWYSQMLLDHAELILYNAVPIFSIHAGVKVSVKIAGIHWHYGTGSHAAELTAGYYNTRFRDGYVPIARMLARYGAVFNFTCLEMRDCGQPEDACCRPEALVQQVAAAAKEAGVSLAAENALPRYDERALEQILNVAISGGLGNRMVAFTYLRMDRQLFEEDNWKKFVSFVERMRK